MHKLIHAKKSSKFIIHTPESHFPDHHNIILFHSTTMMNPSSSSMITTSPQSNPNSILFTFFTQIQMLELLTAILVFVVIQSLRQKKVQGLPNWPLLGMLPSLLIGLRGDVYEWIAGVLHRRRGTFIFRGPWFSNLNCVVTADPRNLEYLLKSRFSNFPKGEYFRDAVRDLLGDGIFSADGDAWHRQRKTASLEFHSGKFRQMAADSIRDLVHARLLPVLEDSVRNSAWIDLQDILLRLTFDNVCLIAFGVDPGCLRPGLPDIPFARAFESATEATIARFVTPTLVWKLMRRFGIGTEGTLKESIQGVDGFAEAVIRTRKEELSDGGGDRADLLSVFMGQKDEQGQEFSDRFLRDICVNFILAGRDTSSVALCWFFWLLSSNRDVEEKILEEICRVISERKLVEEEFGDGLVFEAEEMKKMDYLQAALSEALRLYPSVPVDHKEVLEDDKFPDGTELKKGTKVVYAIYATGRMEAVWGEDCRRFNPDRWLRDGRFSNESAYRFPAFNGGPRLCLGRDFAYYQMKYVAAAVLWRYRVEVAEGHRVEPRMGLTMYMKHGLRVTLSRRNPAEHRRLLEAQ